MPTELVFLGPRHLSFREQEPLPPVGPRDVLLQTLYSGISHGTEMNIYRGTAPAFHKSYEDGLFSEGEPSWGYPMTYGYEEVGRVLERGSAVTEAQVGDLVASSYGHRDLAVVNVDEAAYFNVVPPTLAPQQAILHALGSVALDSYLTSEIRLGETAVVIGLGIIGQFVVQLCRLGGIAPIVAVDMIEGRRQSALAHGATDALDPRQVDVAREVRRLVGRTGADVVFDATGSYRGLQEAIRCGAPIYGRAMAIGWYQGEGAGLRLGEEFHHSSFGAGGTCTIRANNHRVPPAPGRAWDIKRVVNTFFRYMGEGKIDLEGVVSHVIPFSEAARAYQLVDEHPEQVSKVVLKFGD
jgi:2-desacetyl-2-hydroxyethyl bacteriochlorophyllide A dehydrogenase